VASQINVYECVSKIFWTDAVKIINLTTKRVWKTAQAHPATCNVAHWLIRHVSHTHYRCFALPQLLYRLRQQSGIFWIHPCVSLLIDCCKYKWKRIVKCYKPKVNLVTRLLLGVAFARYEPSLHDVELTFQLGFGDLGTGIMWQCIGLLDTNTRRGEWRERYRNCVQNPYWMPFPFCCSN
jgi:hypothetical protein